VPRTFCLSLRPLAFPAPFFPTSYCPNLRTFPPITYFSPLARSATCTSSGVLQSLPFFVQNRVLARWRFPVCSLSHVCKRKTLVVMIALPSEIPTLNGFADPVEPGPTRTSPSENPGDGVERPARERVAISLDNSQPSVPIYDRALPNMNYRLVQPSTLGGTPKAR